MVCKARQSSWTLPVKWTKITWLTKVKYNHNNRNDDNDTVDFCDNIDNKKYDHNNVDNKQKYY